MPYARRGFRRSARGRFGRRAGARSAKTRVAGSRYVSRSRFRKTAKSLRQQLKRQNLNWSNQYVFGGNTESAFMNIGGVSDPPAPFTYAQGPDRDGFVARTLWEPPKLDYVRLLFRAGVTFASEDHTYLRNVISAADNEERAPLRRFRITQNNDVLIKVAPYIRSTAASDSGLEVRDFRLETQHVYCYILLPRHSGNHYDGAPDNKWLAGANSNTKECLRQGIDWDVKQSNVGQTEYDATHRSPVINLSRWRVILKKVISFPPGVNARHFRWKWTFKPSDMVARGLVPIHAYKDYWSNDRMPRMFFVSDARIALGSGEYGQALADFMTMTFSTMGKIYLGDTPVLTTTDRADMPGDGPAPDLGTAAPSMEFETE